MLLRPGTRVDGGAGPDADIVAFSTLCPHQGIALGYRQSDKSLNCPGDYSRFDCEKGGQQIQGQATQNLAQFSLRIDRNGELVTQCIFQVVRQNQYLSFSFHDLLSEQELRYRVL